MGLLKELDRIAHIEDEEDYEQALEYVGHLTRAHVERKRALWFINGCPERQEPPRAGIRQPLPPGRQDLVAYGEYLDYLVSEHDFPCFDLSGDRAVWVRLMQRATYDHAALAIVARWNIDSLGEAANLPGTLARDYLEALVKGGIIKRFKCHPEEAGKPLRFTAIMFEREG